MSEPGFKYLKSYQLSVVIYDLTIEFCNRWINPRSRTHDQMVQAARSGKQNIAEGYLEKSLKMYIKLLGVARASLGELLEDYEDFARQKNIQVWSVEKGRVNLPYSQEEAVNLLLTLINQACFLLDRQGDALEEKFTNEGGYSERLFKKRLAQRS